MEITAAVETDIEELRSIAHGAEAHWGYDRAFMEKFDRVFNITPEFLVDNPVRAARDGGKIMAFWGIKMHGPEAELEYLYVSPKHLGQGIGRYMWRDLTVWCREQQVENLTFVTSHQAVPFYEKMGARRCGEMVSEIDGRMIPRFKYQMGEITSKETAE